MNEKASSSKGASGRATFPCLREQLLPQSGDATVEMCQHLCLLGLQAKLPEIDDLHSKLAQKEAEMNQCKAESAKTLEASSLQLRTAQEKVD